MTIMKNIFISIACLMATICLAASCSSDGSYKVKGTGDMLNDGDTLFLTYDMMTYEPSDTIVVIDGKFLLEGKVDTAATFCVIFSPNDRALIMPLFIEEGSIELNISSQPGGSYVKGTPLNDLWLEMNEGIAALSERMNAIGEQVYTQQLSDEELKVKQEEMKAVNDEYIELITKYATENVDNEFGYVVIISFEETIDPQTHLDLINALPPSKRNRAEVLDVEARLLKTLSTAVGRTLTDITLPDIKGKPLSLLAEVGKNKLTIIDFWASWCAPCRAEMPNVVAVYADYKTKGLGIIGISLDNDKAAWEQATKELGITWQQMSDLQGWQNEAATLYGIRSIPQTIIVDSEGTIKAKNLRGDDLRAFVAEFFE